MNTYNNNKDSPLKTTHNPNYTSPNYQKTTYYNNNKITIFIQTISSLLNKNIFPAFKILSQN